MTNFLSTISDVAVIYDGPHATPKKIENGPYFLSISSLEKGRLDLSRSAHLNEVDFVKWTKRVTPRKGDLLFSYETRLGEVALMPDGVKACLGRRMGLLRPKNGKIISEYFLYAYLSPYFQQVIATNTITGATVNRIALSEMGEFPIRIPPITEQRKVADLLSAIDKKIELNNKINAELEAMAKLIYDYWFVQFDFPDANGKPYKSSGGKMVYNEELKREIPDSWKGTKVGSILDTNLGGTPSTKIKEYWAGNIPWLNSGEIANFPIIEAEDHITPCGIDNSATSLMPKGTCVLSITRHLRPSILAVDACANQSVVGIYESKELKASYLYPYLKNEIPRLMSLRTGAQQPHINKGIVDASPIISPSDEILKTYYEKVNNVYEQINNLAFQNIELIELRDWLLPMLMNGQVTVKDV